MQSRKPPPLPSKLIKSDPDSATSPSKYSPGSKDSATLSANQKSALPDSSDNGSEAGSGTKRKVLRKKKKKKHSNAPDSASSQQGPNQTFSGGAGAAGRDGPPPPPTHGVLIAKNKQQEAEALFKSEKKIWETDKRDHLNLEINKLVHKSKSNFLIQDIKHAMDTAKILQRSESMSHDPDDPEGER